MTSKSTTTKTRRFKPYEPPKWTPHKYQKRTTKFLVGNACAIAMLDPGMGKTSITLNSFNKLKKQKTANKMLVIAPLRVCHQVWPAEVAEWANFKHLKVVVLHGKHKRALLEEEADIYVINPEGLDWLIPENQGAKWRKLGFDTLCIDELTRFKKSTGKRFKLLRSVIGTFSRRWGLTGTPAPNSLLDLFGQCYIIDEGRSLGRYVTHYKREYFRPLDPNGWKWALQTDGAERIYERIAPLAMRLSAEDYLELPEIVPLKHFIELPPAVATLYKTLEDDLIAQYGDGLVVAGNAAAASTKCRQICNGAIYVDDDVASLVRGKSRTVKTLHELKLDAVEELMEDLQGQQLLLAYEFNHDLAALQRRFPKAPHIGKGTTDAEGIIAKWNKGEIPLLLAQPASAGHGLNLQKSNAAHVGWYGITWNYELYDQFIKRVRRQGNTAKRVFNHHFMAKGTLDEVILYDKVRKHKNQEALFSGLLELRNNRR